MNLMKTEQLQKLAIDALEDLKAFDILTLDVRGLTSIADVMIICTGRSSRHVTSLAENVIKNGKAAGITQIRSEGQNEGEWVIVDLNDVIVHVMQQATRDFYNLEDLWEPVKVLRENQR